jgi:hypothetical protein
VTDQFPGSTVALAGCEAVYEEMEGWSQDVRKARKMSESPAAARRYLDRIQELTGTEILVVSVGPGRDETMRIKNPLRVRCSALFVLSTSRMRTAGKRPEKQISLNTHRHHSRYWLFTQCVRGRASKRPVFIDRKRIFLLFTCWSGFSCAGLPGHLEIGGSFVWKGMMEWKDARKERVFWHCWSVLGGYCGVHGQA